LGTTATPTGHPASLTLPGAGHHVLVSGHVIVFNSAAPTCLVTTSFVMDSAPVAGENGPAFMLAATGSGASVASLSFSNILSVPTGGPHTFDLSLTSNTASGCFMSYSLITAADLG
jgi:hypothetical protein